MRLWRVVPRVNLQSNDFELFGLTQQFAQDRAAIDVRWKELQREAHPDKFAAQGVAAQRIAMQWSVRINEAYQRLKDPLKRTAYLCELSGAPILADSNTAMPVAFLTQQIQWREAMDEAQSLAELEALSKEVSAARYQLLQQCEAVLDVQHNPARAVALVRALMFLDKFSQDLNQRFEVLES